MIPVEMQMINFGPFIDSTVKFNFNSALISGELQDSSEASNGAGKSTIFQALTWALTGNSRYKNASRIIRHGSEQAKVILTFKADGSIYKISRGRNRSNKVMLDFYKVSQDGGQEQIKADTNSQLDDKIASVTKVRYDSFLNTVYFAQNSVSEFMYGSSSVRQKLVAEILAMDRWNAHAKRADAKQKEIEKDLDILKMKIAGYSDYKTKLNKLKEARASAQKNLEEAAAESEAATQECDMLARKVSEEAEALRYQELREQTIAELERLRTSKQKTESALGEAKSRQQKLKTEHAGISLDDIGDRPEKILTIKEKLSVLSAERAILLKQIEAASKGQCDGCGWVWGEQHKSHIEEKNSKLEQLAQRMAKGQGFLKEAIKEDEEWLAKEKSNQTKRNKISAIEAALSAVGGEISRLESDVPEKAAQISRLDVVLAGLKEKPTTDSRQAYNAALARRASADGRRLSAERELAGANVQISTIEGNLSELDEMLKTRDSLDKECNIYAALVRHFGKSGIQAHILDSVVAELEILSNSFLARLNHKPFSVKFVTQKQDTKGQAKETFDIEVVSPEGKQSIEDISGGEQFRVAFAVRLALATIQARRLGGELQLLLLDEVSSCLDKRGLSTFVGIIRELEKNMIVMVITHDDSLKEHFDNVIRVKNNGTTATIDQA